MKKTIIYWFRNDLRLHDNEGLYRAYDDAEIVLPVFVFDPRSVDPIPGIDVPKAGPHRIRFLFESLHDLRESLRKRGSDLLIRLGEPVEELAKLSKEQGATAVYAGQEATTEEIDLEQQLAKRLKADHIDLRLFWMLSLYHIDDLPFDVSELPDAYRDFRRGCEKEAHVRQALPEPAISPLPNGIVAGKLPTYTSLGMTKPTVDKRAAINFAGGETEALTRLNSYIWERDQLRNYKYTRNQLLGNDYSSKFSPWLANGCLSPRHVYWEVKRYETERVKNVSTYWLVFELIWRDYFRFQAAKQGALIFQGKGPRQVAVAGWTKDKALFSAWAAGQTGIPFVDAAMRELNATGYLSNRARQNVASLLINRDGKPDLSVWWPWGAAYMESLLIDYDPASNWGNWNLVAKVGADPRNDRYFNIYTQATKYDAKGEYVKLWCPELKNVPADKLQLLSLNSPDELVEWGITLGKNYPKPLVDPQKWTRRKAKSAKT